jgi:anti-sigma factor RsiW
MSEHLSDLALDRLHAGELPDERATALRAHLSGCAACEARLSERTRGFAAFPELDAGLVFARVVAKAEAGVEDGWLTRLRAFFGSLSGALSTSAVALAVVAAVVISQRSSVDEDGVHGTRLKGGLALRVHRQRGDHSEAVASGEAFAPGDRLRFEVDAPDSGYVAILGVESSGKLYRAWPLAAAATTVHLAAGRGVLLDGAVSLDDAVGREVLYLVQCHDQAAPAACTSRGPDQAPRCAPGCSLSPFVLDKRK